PGCGVAKALANILAPATAAPPDVARPDSGFTPFGRPAQLAARVRQALGRDEIFEGPAEGVAAVQPDEMEQFVDKDAGELGGGAIEDDAPFAQIGASMYRAASIPKTACGLEVDGAAGECGQPGGHCGRTG